MPARPKRELKGTPAPTGPAGGESFPSPAASSPTEAPGVIRVALVDDENVMRHGLALLLDREHDIEVVAQAATMQEAAAIDAEPLVVVSDLELPDCRGKDVVVGLRRSMPNASVLVLARISQPARVRDAIAAGAHGYLLKAAQPSDLLVGVRAVAHGESYLQPSLGVALARWPGTGSGDEMTTERLSPKEEEVVRYVALGYTNAEMAHMMGVSLRTVETHRARVLQKLGHPTRAELVAYAQRAGLIDLGP